MAGDKGRLPPRWFITAFWHAHRWVVRATGGRPASSVRSASAARRTARPPRIVAREAVFDRIPISHAVSLFDMDRQFADDWRAGRPARFRRRLAWRGSSRRRDGATRLRLGPGAQVVVAG